MAEEKVALTGVEKAAILLMTLGETAAAQVIKFLGPREVQKIGTAMAARMPTIATTIMISIRVKPDDFFM